MTIVNVQTTTEKLLVQKEGPIGWITFNNSARHNAVSMSMWESIPQGALKVFEDDPEIRLVVLARAKKPSFPARTFRNSRKSVAARKPPMPTMPPAMPQIGRCRNSPNPSSR